MTCQEKGSHQNTKNVAGDLKQIRQVARSLRLPGDHPTPTPQTFWDLKHTQTSATRKEVSVKFYCPSKRRIQIFIVIRSKINWKALIRRHDQHAEPVSHRSQVASLPDSWGISKPLGKRRSPKSIENLVFGHGQKQGFLNVFEMKTCVFHGFGCSGY